mgnify:CR=1 FL=1
MTPPTPGLPSSSVTGRFQSPLVDLRKRAMARLNEKLDPTKNRGKPMSLIRQEAKRTLDQFFEAEAPALQKPERDKIVEELLADAIGFGPMEELFRDADVKEILVLAANVIIVRKNDNWMPSPVRFRDPAHMRAVLQKVCEQGDALVANPTTTSGFDVKLGNGFRAVAILPPDIMEQQPVSLFVRGAGAGSGLNPAITTPPPAATRAPTASGLIATPAPRSGVHSPASTGPRSSASAATAPAGSGSATGIPPARTQSSTGSAGGGFAGQGSGIIAAAQQRVPAAGSGPLTGAGATPEIQTRIRQKVTERIIMKLAAAGVYDLNVIPLPELRKIAMAYVKEYIDVEKILLDDATIERLANEILAGMNR